MKMKKGKAALLVLLFVVVLLLGCEGSSAVSSSGQSSSSTGSSTFTWNDLMSGGLQSLGYMSVTMRDTRCNVVANGQYDYCYVWFTDGTQIVVAKPNGVWTRVQ